MNDRMLDDVTGNGFAWVALGIPAILGWLAIFAAWLIAPHLTLEPIAWMWAIYAVGAWYALWIALLGGWFGMFLLAASF